jgi:hypothetical protein
MTHLARFKEKRAPLMHLLLFKKNLVPLHIKIKK